MSMSPDQLLNEAIIQIVDLQSKLKIVQDRCKMSHDPTLVDLTKEQDKLRDQVRALNDQLLVERSRTAIEVDDWKRACEAEARNRDQDRAARFVAESRLNSLLAKISINLGLEKHDLFCNADHSDILGCSGCSCFHRIGVQLRSYPTTWEEKELAAYDDWQKSLKG